MVTEKRKADELSLVPATKRTKNEVVVSSNKNKALVQTVSEVVFCCAYSSLILKLFR